MRVLKFLRQMLQRVDFFPHKQMLCYRGEDYYATATGGCASIVILGIIFAFILNQFVSVLKKDTINTIIEYDNQLDPTQTQTELSPQGGLMFAVYINGLNFTDSSQRIFDISLLQQEVGLLEAEVNSTEVPMELCTIDHFAFNVELQQQFYSLGVKEWLCPPLNYSMKLKGKISSTKSKRLQLVVRDCASGGFTNCLPDVNISALESQLGAFRLVMSVISPQVNYSSTEENVVFHRQELSRFEFTTSFAVRGTLQLADYQMETDESLLFFDEVTRLRGVYAPNPMAYDVLPNSGTNYAKILFEQSSTSVTYIRFYSRVDDFLAYVGGLISSAIALIFIFSFYNEMSYYISVSSKLFIPEKGKTINSAGYNICLFIAHLPYRLALWLGCYQGGGTMGVYFEAQQEVKKQLDVVLLMRRINYLERGLALLLPEHQLQLLHIYQKHTLQEAAQKRKKHHLVYKLEKQIHQESNKTDKVEMMELQHSINQSIRAPLNSYSLQPNHSQGQNSRSSFSSVANSATKLLRDKARMLDQESKWGNQISHRIMTGIDDRHCQELLREQRDLRYFRTEHRPVPQELPSWTMMDNISQPQMPKLEELWPQHIPRTNNLLQGNEHLIQERDYFGQRQLCPAKNNKSGHLYEK